MRCRLYFNNLDDFNIMFHLILQNNFDCMIILILYIMLIVMDKIMVFLPKKLNYIWLKRIWPIAASTEEDLRISDSRRRNNVEHALLLDWIVGRGVRSACRLRYDGWGLNNKSKL